MAWAISTVSPLRHCSAEAGDSVRSSRGRRCRKPLAVKSRLRESALPAMRIAFAVEEPLAEKLLGDIAPPAFDELPVMRH